MDEVNEDETAASRGRIPVYDFPIQMQMCAYLCKRISSRVKMRRLLLRVGLPYRILCKLGKPDLYQQIVVAIHRHYYSYNKLSRPVPVYDAERMEEPWKELNEVVFYESFGFWKSQFIEVVNNLSLMPRVIGASNSRAKAPMPMALCIVLRRWRVADTWEKVAKFFRVGKVWCIVIYKSTINQLCFHYRQVVKVIDYARVTPKFEEWCDIVNERVI